MSKAAPSHWMVVKHIVRYLKNTLDFKLYLGGKDINLRGFCDANWAEIQTMSNPPRGTCFLLVLESFYGNEKNNQPLYCLRRR